MKQSISAFLTLMIFLAASAAVSADVVKLEYYGDIGCSHCDQFKAKILPEAEERAGVTTEAAYFDILSESGYQACEVRLQEMGYVFTFFPVLFVGNNAYMGNDAVERGIAEELLYFAENGEYRPRIEPQQAAEETVITSLSFVPVFLAGLVDGVNPCAFATMLFFLSWIALKGGSKKRMILAGTGFIAGVFFAYLLIGFGLFSFFRAAETMVMIRQIMRYLFTFLALLFAALSLRDALEIRRTGKPGSMLLQLPVGLKRRIHALIRRSEEGGNRNSFFLLLSLVFTGIVVALLELACTGQIYFPTIAYMVQSGGGSSPVFWLLLYNIAFILPLLLLFVLTLAGVSQQKVGNWFKRNLVTGKILTAVLFTLLAVVIWISG